MADGEQQVQVCRISATNATYAQLAYTRRMINEWPYLPKLTRILFLARLRTILFFLHLARRPDKQNRMSKHKGSC